MTYSMSCAPKLFALSNAGSEGQGSSNHHPEAMQNSSLSTSFTSVHPMKAARQELLFKLSY